MKKILIACAILVLVSAVYMHTKFNSGEIKADDDSLDTGLLAYLGTTEEEFQNGFDNFREFVLSSDKSADFHADDFIKSISENSRKFHFYNTLMALIMDLKSGKLDEIILPEHVGKYLLNRNNFYDGAFNMKILSSGICFAFKADDAELRDKINAVIKDMNDDGTLAKFAEIYIFNDTAKDPEPIRPEKINDAEELRIAVTGDLPPMDMFAPDGKPTGYNTAILAEIGKRLSPPRSIKFINTEAGSRTSALMSGRVDAVFWYRVTKSEIEGDDPLDNIFKDAPEGVILSDPYHSWTNEIVLQKKDGQKFLGLSSK